MDARWRPTEGRYISVDRIEVGMILAVDHPDWRHQPWRVHEIREREDGRRIYFRPPGEQYDLAGHNRPATVGKHAPVTRRQDVHRFDENLYVPLGPPVTFHARQACAGGAVAYDSAIAKKNGTQARLSCEGHIVHHLDGDRACSNITCPGPRLRHRAMSMCYVLAEKCNRPECWAIDDTATRAHRENGSTT